jgi:hypothetical protein
MMGPCDGCSISGGASNVADIEVRGEKNVAIAALKTLLLRNP